MKCPDCQGEVMEIRGGYYCTKCGNKIDLEQIKLQLEAKVAQAKEKAQEQLEKVDDSSNMFASKHEDIPQPPAPAENQLPENEPTQIVNDNNSKALNSEPDSPQVPPVVEEDSQMADQIVNPLPPSQESNQTSPEEVSHQEISNNDNQPQDLSQPLEKNTSVKNMAGDNLTDVQPAQLASEGSHVEPSQGSQNPEPPELVTPQDESIVSQPAVVDLPNTGQLNNTHIPETPVAADPSAVPPLPNIPPADLAQAKVEMPLNEKNHLLGSLKAKILLISIIVINILIMGAIIYYLVLKND